jgi:methylmalonyl-CoA/ethylmalonyl-CoA epimerase
MDQSPTSGTGELLFDHVGIVVPDLETGIRKFAAILGEVSWTRRFDDSRLGVSVQFARDRVGITYELIAPLTADSPVARTVKSGANLLNQLAYRTNSLEAAVDRLRPQGSLPITLPTPALAFGGAHVQFLMTPLGFLLELIEVDSCVHDFLPP